MRFRNAKKLHNEDEVYIKKEHRYTDVLNVWIPEENPKIVLIECVDGHIYTHREIA